MNKALAFLFAAYSAAAGMLSDGDPITVSQFSFTGNQEISTAELEDMAAPYTGRTIEVEDLELLRQQISQAYIERGYINSGAVIDDQPNDGIVLISCRKS